MKSRRYTEADIVGQTLSADRRSVTFRFSDGNSRTYPRVAGGDRHPLAGQVAELDDQITELRNDAGTKYRELQEAEKAVADVPADELTPEHEAYKRLEDAGKAHGELGDSIASKTRVRETLIKRMADSGLTPPAEPSDSPKSKRESSAALREVRGILQAGKRITDSDAYKELAESGLLQSKSALGVRALGEGWSRDEVKALITGASPTSAGAFVEPDQVGYFPMPMRPHRVLDLITVGETDSDSVEYVKETSYTNAAAETPEAISAAVIGDGTGGTVTAVQGGRKPESAIAFVKQSASVETIAHWVPATKRSLADAGQMRTIIDGRLRWGLDDRVETQVVAGDGVGDNLRGILNQTGLNSIAAGPRSIADKCASAMTEVRIDGFEPSGVLLHPRDAEEVRLSRENADGSGIYLFGAPNSPGPLTLWGKPIAESASVPEGTAIVGELRAFIFWLREGAQVIASDSHMDFFTRNLVAILAELRGAAGLPTPQALCEVDLAAA